MSKSGDNDVLYFKECQVKPWKIHNHLPFNSRKGSCLQHLKRFRGRGQVPPYWIHHYLSKAKIFI